MKRKRLDSKPVDVSSNSPSKHTSTFVDGGKTKKLKIDDMSTIVESTCNEESILNDTNNMSKKSRSLRPRKKKNSVGRTLKKSKRIANLSKVEYVESPISQNTRTPTFVQDTPSPIKRSKHCSNNDKTTVCSDSVVETSSNLAVVVSPVNHATVQPRVAALIEQLKLSSQKQMSKDPGPMSKPLDDVKATLFPTAEEAEDSPLKISNTRYIYI